MKLIQATRPSAWGTASEILSSTVSRLNVMGTPLWSHEQISEKALSNSYELKELYIIEQDDRSLGLVFLQEADARSWPDVNDNASLFLHKLTIDPTFCGQGYGAKALELIAHQGQEMKKEWVRLDCDDREPLRRFYEDNGFKLVDRKKIAGFKVVRYQMPTSHAS